MRKDFNAVLAVQGALTVAGPNPVGVLCGSEEEQAAVEAVIGKLACHHRVFAKVETRAKIPTEKEIRQLRAAEREAAGQPPLKRNAWHQARRANRLANG